MKHILLYFLILTFSSSLSAQDSVDGFMKLFDWVEKLDENISSIVRTENKKKLLRQLDYVQGDLDDFIVKKKEITKHLIQHCTDSSVSIPEIEKKLDDYNKEINILKNRFGKIRKTIIFEDELYSITEKKIVTVYRKPPLEEMSNDTLPERMMVQQSLSNKRPDGKVPKDTLMNVTVNKNKNEWKEVDIEDLLFEIEKSLETKGSNMEYIVNELTKDCNLELINEESNMAIHVLTNIRNEFREIRKKVKNYKPQ